MGAETMTPGIDSRTMLGVALLGNGFMAKAHAKALLDLAMLEDRDLRPQLVSICARDEASLARSRERFGWERHTRDWREQIEDPRVALFDNTAPNALHCEPTIAALAAGKHVLCEKPLAPSAEQAYAMWQAAEAAGVVHMCGFNFRFAPALRLAYEMIQAGEIGEIVHCRAQFLESYGLRRARLGWRDRAGEAAGALGDLGCHIVDLMRWLAGEPIVVQARSQALAADRGPSGVRVEDAFGALFELEGGASGVLEASRVAGGTGSRCAVEIDGVDGTLRFSSEHVNDLHHTSADHVRRTIRATGETHPYMRIWWPDPGHEIGWGDTFTHEVGHLLDAIEGRTPLRPIGADFEDGYRCAEICEAIGRAAATGASARIAYRSL